ncbi:hypothetical protein KIN20_030807 [Parelaphostrongylus tenuis]|uniref:Uncharacterized protein n=1 Tax=Parelaphostrongylus tenuis TaxID=148309 RepID=A0AAD5WGL0_PARTN|nr:hypothetical protein KIN20_030807 [Parelaphostrongylus tenuis]
MKCNPSHLQRFLDNLLAALRGDEISISTLAKVRRSDFKAASTVLQVTQGDLKVVPSRLSELEVIELVGCELRSVESRWFALPMLLCLELADNCLGKATDFVKFKLLSRLKNLQYLSLMNNEIETIPPYFFESLPPSLITLNLSHNRLVSLPKSLVNVRNLRTLYLGHNLLSHLPRDMSDMDLRCLCVDHNRLPWLPHDLRSRRFEKLYFSNNPMVAPSPYIIGPVVPSLTSVAFASLRSHSLQEDILPWDLKMIGDNLCMKCSCCRLWTATSLLSMCLVGERVSEFADETDTMQPVTMRSFSCQKCVGRVTVSLPSPFRP